MAFKRPLPIIMRKENTRTLNFDTDLPTFSKSECSNPTVIGVGSFGKVSKVTKGRRLFVLKELNSADASEMEHKLFVKEAKLLHSLVGCDNIVTFHGIATDGCSLLLEYCCFTFAPLLIPHDEVHNLKELLLAGNLLCGFDGFEHWQEFLALDIVSGLQHLHAKDIAHRDLKPHNILVSNSHYSRETDFDTIQRFWASKPVIFVMSL
jgi:serine/threonine protein kinase